LFYKSGSFREVLSGFFRCALQAGGLLKQLSLKILRLKDNHKYIVIRFLLVQFTANVL